MSRTGKLRNPSVADSNVSFGSDKTERIAENADCSPIKTIIVPVGHHKKKENKFFQKKQVFIFVDRMTNNKAYGYFYFSFYFTRSREPFC